MATSTAASASTARPIASTAEGRYSLPAIELKWWDASSRQTRMAASACRDLRRRGQQRLSSRCSRSAEDLNNSASNIACTSPGIGLGLLALLLGVALFAWFCAPVVHRALPRMASPAPRPARRLAGVRRLRLAADPGATRGQPPQLSALYLWARRSRIGPEATGLGASPARPVCVPVTAAKPTEDQALRQLKAILDYAAESGRTQQRISRARTCDHSTPFTRRISHDEPDIAAANATG